MPLLDLKISDYPDDRMLVPLQMFFGAVGDIKEIAGLIPRQAMGYGCSLSDEALLTLIIEIKNKCEKAVQLLPFARDVIKAHTQECQQEPTK